MSASEPGAEMSVHYFRGLVQSQTNRLEELCDKWSKILQYKLDQCSADRPLDDRQEGDESREEEDTCGAIRSTIGKAKLLVSQRFSQFSSLIDDCEFKRGQLPTRLEDLLGFWEMIDCQVKDVLSGFESLHERTLNGHTN